MKFRIISFFTAISLYLVLSGCTSIGSYQSQEVLDKSLRGKLMKPYREYEGPSRNPVIVIHGFLGSKLRDEANGRVVWGEVSFWDSITGLNDQYIYDLSLKMSKDHSLIELDENAEAYSFLESLEVQLFGIPLYFNVYEDLLLILLKSGYVEYGKPLPEGKHFYSLFPFYYDWRQDLPYSASKLHKYILRNRAYLQKEYEKNYGIKNYDVQFDIVAHSMGGLLSRYYLRYGDEDLPADNSIPEITWKGSKYIDKLLVVGTPNAGYLDTVLELINGLRVAFGTPKYPPALIGTFATYYQMMPVYGFRSVLYEDDPNGAEVDIFDPDVWIELNWGLADPRQDSILQILLPDVDDPVERREIALDYLRKSLRRAKQFTMAMQVKARPPDDVAMFLFAGNAVETSRTALVNRKTGAVRVTEYGPGDGKVLTSSALFDLREDGYWTPFIRSPISWMGTFLLPAAHMGIIKSNTFSSNASYGLLVTPSVKQDKRDKKSILSHKNLAPVSSYLGNGVFDKK